MNFWKNGSLATFAIVFYCFLLIGYAKSVDSSFGNELISKDNSLNKGSKEVSQITNKYENGWNKYKDEARGALKKKSHKYLYPVLIGLFIAKVIIFPVILKALTIMSTASLVLSKMSLLTTIMLGFKWFLTHNHNNIHSKNSDSKVEILHLPALKKKATNQWDREIENKYHVINGNDHYDTYIEQK